MKKIISLFLVLTMLLGCFAAFGITSSAAVASITIDKTNTKVTGSTDGNAVVCKDFDTWAACNPNWSFNIHLRPTGRANEYTVIATVKDLDPAIRTGENNQSITITAALLKKYSGFTHVNGDIYMILNGSENYGAMSALPGYTVTLTNVDPTVTGTCTNAKAEISADLASMSGGLINNNNPQTKLVNSVANVQIVSASEAVSVISGANAPASILVSANGADLGAIFDACIEHAVLPTVQIDNATQKTAVINAMKNKGFYDVNVISADASLLGDVHKTHNFVRTGLIYNIPKNSLTTVEADAIRRAVRSAPAMFVVVESTNANRQTIYEIQELGVPVWVKMSSAKSTDAFNVEVTNTIAAGANAIISQSSAEVTALINKHFYTDKSMTRTPVAVAHRGDVTAAAENTIEAFWGAYNNGADYVEMDVRITSDNQIVLFHDSKLNEQAGLTNYTGTKSIAQMTLAEVQKYTYSTGEKIPSLDEVLETFADVDISMFVEFKGGGDSKTVELTANLIKEYNMQHKVVIISSSNKYLEHTDTYFSKQMTNSFVYGTYSLFAGTPYTNTDSEAEMFEILALTLPYCHSSNAALGPFYSAVANRWMGEATTDRGIFLSPWTYESNNNANIGFFSNVDSMTTDVTPFFTNMAKYVEGSDFTISAGQPYIGGALTATTYGNKEVNVPAEDTVFSVVSGDAVKVNNGKLEAVKEGSAKVLMGYKTKTTTGASYVIYSELVTVTVDNSKTGALEYLMAVAKESTVKEFNGEDLAALNQLYDEAKTLVESDNPDESEIERVSEALTTVLAKRRGTDIIEPESYVAPENNYYKWDSAANAPSTEVNELYSDDGIRLTDGNKNNTNAASNGYCVWQNTNVNIDVNLGKKQPSNIYNAYFACHEWGVAAPDAIGIYYSDNGTNWTMLDAECVITTVKDTSAGKTYDEYKEDGLWSLYKYTVTSDVDINAQYIRFFVDIKGNFIWMDEVEVLWDHGQELEGEYVYLTGMNGSIGSGDSFVYTPDFGTISTQNANHSWTANIIAKWNDDANGYVINEVSHGTGGNTPSVTLADDEIMIAVHAWGDTHPDSVANKEVASNALVGQKLEFYGIDVATKTIGIAPYVRFVDFENGGNDNDESSDVNDESSDVVDDSSDVNDDSSDVIDESSDVVDDSSDVNDDSSDIVEDSSDVIDDSSDVNDESSDTSSEDTSSDVSDGDTSDDEEEVETGDINENGKIDMTDYILLKRAYFGTYTFNDRQNKAGDINANGKIDMTDYILLKRIYFGTYTLKK